MSARAPRELAGAPRTDDREGVAQLREVLHGAGFTAEAVQQALTTDGAFSRNPEDFPLYLRLMPESRLATLVKLFFLGVRVPRDEAAQALAPLALERVERIGIVRLEGGEAFSTVEISPTEDFLFAYDHPEYGLDRPDHVLGMSPPTKVLACLTVRRPVERALDVGTGSGLQALLAAQHSARVVAVDINPRALAFARFNAALNGFENVETREGSVFEPVEGEQFDLIVSNPPYVISPETDYIYRDSGLPGHSFCEGLVKRMPEFLREGGYAHVLVS